MDKNSKLAQTSIPGKNGGTLIPITSATAADLARRRWAKFRQAAARRVTGEAVEIDPTATSAPEAWGLAVARQYKLLLNSDKPRGDDLIRIGQAIGSMPMAHEMRITGEDTPVRVETVNVLIAQYVGKQLRANNAEVIDSE